MRIPGGFGIDVEKIRERERDECHENCPEFEDWSKKYPKVAHQLYLTHCADHGHCYGFYLIKGRKDPNYSLLLQLKKKQIDVWYDFCCAFHEYCMNRDNGYCVTEPNSSMMNFMDTTTNASTCFLPLG